MTITKSYLKREWESIFTIAKNYKESCEEDKWLYASDLELTTRGFVVDAMRFMGKVEEYSADEELDMAMKLGKELGFTIPKEI